VTVLSALDAAGRRRSPATLPGATTPAPAAPQGNSVPGRPAVEEIVAVMRHARDDRHGWRVRAMIIVLRRAGLRVREALALAEHDLDPRRGSLLVRNGKRGRRWEVGMDEWGLGATPPVAGRARRAARRHAVLHHRRPTRGRPWSGAAVRSEYRRLAAGV
jgi:site-specific recombinase XerC